MKRVLIAAAIAILAASADSQTSYSTDPMSNINMGYAIPRRQKKGTPTPASGKQDDKKQDDKKQQGTPTPKSGSKSAQTRSATGGTSSTASAPKRAPSSSAKPGANAPMTAGQVKQITKAFADFARTRRVYYDEHALAQKPGVVILNPRRYRSDEDPAHRMLSPANSGEAIAQPL